jgi:YGGT family
MSVDQEPTTSPDRPPADVVVTTGAPAGGTAGAREPPAATQVDVYPPSAGTTNALAAEREIRPLRVRQDVVRGQRMAVGKLIDTCWYLLGVLEVLLALRFFFKLTAAGAAAGFVQLIYGVTQPFAWPFAGIFGVPRDGNNVFDPNVIVAMAVYALIAWGITRLLAMTIEPPSVG